MFAKWEWIIIELLVLGLLVFELVRTRRDIRRAKQADQRTNDTDNRNP